MKSFPGAGKRPGIKALIVLACLLAASLAILTPKRDLPVEDTQQSAMPVTVLPVTPRSQALTWTLSAVSRSRWPTRLNANVSGRIRELPPQRLPGDSVERGALLLAVDPTDYVEQEAAAAARVAQAELELARIRHEQTVAQRINQQAKTPFARLEPHLHAAQAELAAAEAARESARMRLADTRIIAPFNALILARQVHPGQWINVDDPLFDLAAAAQMDVVVEVTEPQWQRLHQGRKDLSIHIAAPGGFRAPAAIRYVDPQRNPATRQRSLVLSVSRSDAEGRALLPESLVQVSLRGAALPDIVRLPASALTADGQVWVVDENDRLHAEEISVIEETETEIVARFSRAAASARRLVRFPLSTMLEGQLVKPLDGDED